MKFKNVIVSALLISSIAVAGCAPNEAPTDNSQDTQNEQAIDSEKETENSDTQEEALNYEINEEVLEVADKNIKISYPQVKNYPGELLMDYMNQSLKKITDTYGNGESYTDVNIEYDITRMDKDVLSVLFKGTVNMEGIGEVKIQQSMSLDMASSSNEINYDNFIKDDEKSKEEVMKILNEKAKENGLEGLEAEGIQIYFDGENVVFYYMPLDDSAKEFIELSVPMTELEGHVNTEFGEAPAS